MPRIGIDLGGTKTEGVVMDPVGKILFRERRTTPAAQGYETVLNNIRDIVRHLEAQAGGVRPSFGLIGFLSKLRRARRGATAVQRR